MIEAEWRTPPPRRRTRTSFNGAASVIEAEAFLTVPSLLRGLSFNGAASVIEAEGGDGVVDPGEECASTGPPR